MLNILPNKKIDKIQKIKVDNKIIFATTSGLKKDTNEDRIGSMQDENIFRFCLADGHWGSETADIIVKFWLDKKLDFPKSKLEAIKLTKKLEKRLYKKFGKNEMDEENDFTPESSMLAMEISGSKLTLVNYGDCRLITTTNKKVEYEMETKATWLGAFSYLGLRDRISVSNALKYETIDIENIDYIIAFTDGIDECIYEIPTISSKQLANTTKLDNSNDIVDDILQKVFKIGAEDNASILVIQTPF